MDEQEVDDGVGKKLSLATVEKSTDKRFELLDSVIGSLEKNEEAILDNFQDEICNFTNDKNPSIRSLVIRFVFLSIKRERDTIVSLLAPLNALMSDECSNVLSRTLVTLCHILPIYAEGNSKMPVRETLVEIYETVVRLLEDENDGIRTQAVRVVEEFVTFKNEDFSLFDNAILTLTDFLKKATISNGNLVAGLTSLSRIAKTEADYISTVISEFENLNASLPPTLSITQVKNVRKLIRIQLIDLLKSCPETQEHASSISTLLRDLGMGKTEIERTMKQMAIDKGDDKRKTANYSQAMDDDRDPDEIERPVKRNRADHEREQIEELADELYDGLCTIDDVVDLVILSLPGVPEKMQPSFSSTYTPITSAGSYKQKMTVARLLANQITQAGFGKRQDLLNSPKKRRKNSNETQLGKVKDNKVDTMDELKAMDKDLENANTGRSEFNLENITSGLSQDVKFNMVRMAVDDMVKGLSKPTHNSTLHGMMTKVVAHFSGTLPMVVADIIEKNTNPRNRIEIALSWLYAEYDKYLDVRESPSDMQALENYNLCITILLTLLKEKNADVMFDQLLFQAPLLTEDTFGLLIQFCVDGEGESSEALVSTLGKLAIQRLVNRKKLVELLLQLSTHYIPQIRIRALDQIVTIYEQFQSEENIVDHILTHIIKSLEFLIFEEPPQALSEIASDWTEDLIERCLDLSTAILPFNADVLMNLCDVFNRTPSITVKRVISRAIDAPVRRLSQTNPSFLTLVKNIPEGCESLITRVLHIVTEKRVEQELIDAIKHIMSTERRDIRFMIPILGVLPKDEVIQALPELIQLHKKVVKEVFFRLLGVQSGSQISEGDQHVAPLKATELLVELHLMEGASVKPAIEAIALCLAEKTVFTLEVFASAISRMLKFETLPALFMRTVLQALITHPRITSEIILTLKTLITRKIWHTQKLWDGFVMCCQKLKARSVSVLLKLPKEPLDKILITAPDLKAYLVTYLESIEPTERSMMGEQFQNISMITAS